jgi:hypothetical protein
VAQGPTVRRLQLGRELRRLREAADVPRDAAAARLSRDYTWLSRAEGGKLAPSVAEVELLLNFYGVDSGSEECERILDIAREARKRSAYRVPEWVRAYVGMEAEAVEIKDFQIDLVPGLLQTEEYTRAITKAFDPTRAPEEVERLVAIRRERQARILGDAPPQLWIVMDEAAIRRVVGGPEVMRAQLDRLLELARLPSVSVQIMPYSAGAHPAMGTSFRIVRLPEPPGTEVAVLEDLWSAEYLEREAQVSAYVQVFDKLCHIALDVASSTKTIKQVAGELK